MTDALVHRRRVALRLLLLQAGLLAGIIGGFALLSWWLAGGSGSAAELATAAALMLTCLLVNWFLVRSGWRHLGDDFGGGGQAP